MADRIDVGPAPENLGMDRPLAVHAAETGKTWPSRSTITKSLGP